jgi:hypothetical protein
MRRKYWPFVFLAVALYMTVVWSAYQWGASQRLPDGSIFEHLANQSRERALASAPTGSPPLPPTPDSRFHDAGPAFVAIRQGTSHVVFIVDQTSLVFGRHSGHPQRIAVSATPAAELAGLRELWGPTPEVFDSLPGMVKNTPVGQPWVLELSPDSSIPVTIDRAVLADTGCSLSVGFLATVPPSQRAAFAATSEDYFVVWRLPVAPAEPPQSPEQVSETDWHPTPAFERQLVGLLTDRMRRDLPQVDADLLDNQDYIAQREETWPLVRPAGTWLAEWKHLDRQLQDGQGQLNYDTRAFRLTPDGVPRLFVRARWRIAGTTGFLMSAWFRADPTPTLLSSDSGWSNQLRQGKLENSFLEHGEFQSILNVFDADHDGWAELLIYRQGVASSSISLYRYNDLGLIPMKASLRQDQAARTSCLPGLQAQTEIR